MTECSETKEDMPALGKLQNNQFQKRTLKEKTERSDKWPLIGSNTTVVRRAQRGRSKSVVTEAEEMIVRHIHSLYSNATHVTQQPVGDEPQPKNAY
jgi:hypothetical protein